MTKKNKRTAIVQNFSLNQQSKNASKKINPSSFNETEKSNKKVRTENSGSDTNQSEKNNNEEENNEEIDEEEYQENVDLDVTLKSLNYFVQNPQILLQKRHRQVRSLLYQLHQSKGQTPSGRISDALRDGRFEEANIILSEMRRNKQVPKLGALQRWVRDCDAATSNYSDNNAKTSVSNEVFRTLDSILRTADPELFEIVNNDKKEAEEEVIQKREVWYPYTQEKIKNEDFIVELSEDIKKNFSIVFEEKGSDRKPPNQFPMTLYTSLPGTIDTSLYNTQVLNSNPLSRIDVPHIPGVFVIPKLFSVAECARIISCAESVGFVPDIPLEKSNSVLAHNFCLLADEQLNDAVFSRCRHLFPRQLPVTTNTNNNNSGRSGGEAKKCELVGLNARWRVYRYAPGAVYRPHIDGSWPQSGLVTTFEEKEGEKEEKVGKVSYSYDVSGGRVLSRLTFLIRLNDDYCGGATTYFLPVNGAPGRLAACPVNCFSGDALVFPHGDAKGSLLHEGSEVTPSTSFSTSENHQENLQFRDLKYVIRTEVLYTNP